MTARIGERVAHFRSVRKMTLQALADRCAERGVPLGRVTLTKLEGGKRQAVTPWELAVLAAALDVAPVELLYPIGSGKQVEMLPGIEVEPLTAANWFSGDKILDFEQVPPVVRDPRPGEQTSVLLLRYHQAVVDKWQDYQRKAVEAGLATSADGANERAREDASYAFAVAERYRKDAGEILSWIRADLRSQGMELPPVPDLLDLDVVDDPALRDRAASEGDGDS